MSSKQVEDRRVQRTQRLLRDALVSLIHERDYDSIAVKEILDRADIGRSTFYTHFGTKDDLLARGLREMLRPKASPGSASSGREGEDLLAFSLPVFEQLQRHHQARDAGTVGRTQATVHERLRQEIVDQVTPDVRRALHGRERGTTPVPPELLAQTIASTFLLVFEWWLANGSALPPRAVDALFRALTLPTVTAALKSQ